MLSIRPACTSHRLGYAVQSAVLWVMLIMPVRGLRSSCGLILQLLQSVGALAGAAKMRTPLVWWTAELRSTSRAEGRPQRAWPCAVPWEGEYIAPIIGSDMKGCQFIGYLPCEPLSIKGRLFCAVLAEGQLQLPLPAILPQKRFSEKAPQKNTSWFLFS